MFYHKIEQLPENRKRPIFSVKELIVSGLLVFLFKQKSRNSADNAAKNIDYQDNIKRFFNIKVADMDTVNRYLSFLEPSHLEDIKQDLLKHLIRSKTLNKYRFLDNYFVLAIDGTGLQSFDYEPYKGCTFRTLNNEKTIWTTFVLEAKLVSQTGLAISIATQWIENPTDGNFEKQDSEQKAFKILVQKIKDKFPQLPFVLLLDGLYPYEPIFSLINKFKWLFIITLKNNQLPSVDKQIKEMIEYQEYFSLIKKNIEGKSEYLNHYKIIKGVLFKENKYHILRNDFKITNIETREIKKEVKLVHITNI